MKLFYITNARIPTNKAHGIQIAKMGEQFTRHLGKNFCLVLPFRFETDPKLKGKTMREIYALKVVPQFAKLPVLDLHPFVPWQNLAYFLETFTFGLAALLFVLICHPDKIYTRDIYLLPLLLLSGKPIFYECHFFPRTKLGITLHRLLLPKLAGVVAINKTFQKFFDKEKIKYKILHVAHNGADVDFFTQFDKAKRKRLVERFGLSNNLVAGYIGRLSGAGEDKGKQTLFLAMVSLCAKYQNLRFLIVGEEATNLSSFKRVVPEKFRSRFIFTGFVPYFQMPIYFSLLDVGIIPFPLKRHFQFFMSPLKLFDYLAAGTPIVTSDFPSLREVVTDKNAIFVHPDDHKSLARAIGDLIDRPAKRRQMSLQNKLLSKKYTWKIRVNNILKFIQTS